MIALHSITGKNTFKLTDLQIIALGDGLIAGYDMRLRVDGRDVVTVQHVSWWGTAVTHFYHPYHHNTRERNTRRRRGLIALEPDNRLTVYFTPAARRARGLA